MASRLSRKELKIVKYLLIYMFIKLNLWDSDRDKGDTWDTTNYFFIVFIGFKWSKTCCPGCPVSVPLLSVCFFRDLALLDRRDA